jgi:hypothetical protein
VKGADRSSFRREEGYDVDATGPIDRNLHRVQAALPHRLRLVPLVATWCALSPAELVGLQRRDVKLSDRCLFVVRCVEQTDDGAARYRDLDPTVGPRLAHLSMPLTLALGAHLNAFVGPRLDAPVFADKQGRLLTPLGLSRRLARAEAKAKGRRDPLGHLAPGGRGETPEREGLDELLIVG